MIGADAANRVPHLAFQPEGVKAQTILPMDEITSSYYLRVQAKDEPGTLGKIANLLAEQGVSIEALIQKGVINKTTAEIVILTHSTVEKKHQISHCLHRTIGLRGNTDYHDPHGKSAWLSNR